MSVRKPAWAGGQNAGWRLKTWVLVLVVTNQCRELHSAVDLPEPSFHLYEKRNSVEWSLSDVKLYDSKCYKFGNINI